MIFFCNIQICEVTFKHKINESRTEFLASWIFEKIYKSKPLKNKDETKTSVDPHNHNWPNGKKWFTCYVGIWGGWVGGGRGKISRLILFKKFCNPFLFFCGHTVTKPIMDKRYWTIFSICRKCLLFCKILIYVIRAVIACLQSWIWVSEITSLSVTTDCN